ncbi:MAG: hypothetical protein RLZZ362_2209 [Actinomycetota bacterium]|jgi:hypothetical protein
MLLSAWQFVIYPLAIAAVASGAVVPPTDRHLALFAHVYEIEVTPANRRLLSSAIRWSRCWRIGGAVVAMVAGVVIDLIADNDLNWGLFPIAVGCAVGGTIGEWVRPRSAPRGRRRASLRPRGMTDYVRPWVVSSVLAFLALAGTCAAIYAAIWPVDDRTRTWPWAPRPMVMGGIVLGGLVLTALTVLVGTAVARRPEPTGEASIAAVHHAVRSAALVSLSGTALMAASGTAYFSSLRVYQYADGAASTIGSITTWTSGLGMLVGLMLSIRSIPRFAPFWRRLPPVPQAT